MSVSSFLFYTQQFSTIPFQDEASGNQQSHFPPAFPCSFFPSAQEEDEALEFARICFQQRSKL